MGKEIGKGESRERHLKERGRVSLVLSDRVWEMSPYCIRTVTGGELTPLDLNQYQSRALTQLSLPLSLPHKPGPPRSGCPRHPPLAWLCTHLTTTSNTNNSMPPKKIKPKRHHGYDAFLFVLGTLFPPLGPSHLFPFFHSYQPSPSRCRPFRHRT